jgi:hypothetical protein
LLSPAAVAAIVVLVVNDHWGKAYFANTLTGKLSDGAGLLFFPLLVISLLEGAWALWSRQPQRVNRRLVTSAVAATGAAFAAVKLSAPIAELWSQLIGVGFHPIRVLLAVSNGAPMPDVAPVVVRADPWDLLALPVLVVPLLLGWSHVRAPATVSARCR